MISILEIVGEGEYNLNVVDEVRVTDSFLGLHKDVRGCQTEELFIDCKTQEYKNKVLEYCHCLPLKLKTSVDVSTRHVYHHSLNYFYQHFDFEMIKDTACDSEQMECVRNTTLGSSQCQQNCDGLNILSYDKTTNRNIKSFLGDIKTDYDEYKNMISLPKSLGQHKK